MLVSAPRAHTIVNAIKSSSEWPPDRWDRVKAAPFFLLPVRMRKLFSTFSRRATCCTDHEWGKRVRRARTCFQNCQLTEDLQTVFHNARTHIVILHLASGSFHPLLICILLFALRCQRRSHVDVGCAQSGSSRLSAAPNSKWKLDADSLKRASVILPLPVVL
jgi:hypothetical protein